MRSALPLVLNTQCTRFVEYVCGTITIPPEFALALCRPKGAYVFSRSADPALTRWANEFRPFGARPYQEQLLSVTINCFRFRSSVVLGKSTLSALGHQGIGRFCGYFVPLGYTRILLASPVFKRAMAFEKSFIGMRSVMTGCRSSLPLLSRAVIWYQV